ncbi:MAG: hypothetical protein KDA85_19155 [Planctomycetaceae bacterium]|nr:hypothetical protein [Planctomycetaceae bacterium]
MAVILVLLTGRLTGGSLADNTARPHGEESHPTSTDSVRRHWGTVGHDVVFRHANNTAEMPSLSEEGTADHEQGIPPRSTQLRPGNSIGSSAQAMRVTRSPGPRVTRSGHTPAQGDTVPTSGSHSLVAVHVLLRQ